MNDKALPNSKELYMMNAGNKTYIYKDGFGDVYEATVEEEAEWKKEIVSNCLLKLDEEENEVVLKFAIETLLYHDFPGLEHLVANKLENVSVRKKIAFAAALWKNFRAHQSFMIIYEQFVLHRATCRDHVFTALTDLSGNSEANDFIIECLEAEDENLFLKAVTTINMWAYTGIPELRENDLLNKLAEGKANKNQFLQLVKAIKVILNDHIKK